MSIGEWIASGVEVPMPKLPPPEPPARCLKCGDDMDRVDDEDGPLAAEQRRAARAGDWACRRCRIYVWDGSSPAGEGPSEEGANR